MTDGKKRRSMSTVRSSGAQLRLEALQVQLAVAFNLCATAQNALVLRRGQDARKAIDMAKHAVQSIRFHANEHGHLPAGSSAGILDRLVELEGQISKLEEKISS